MFEIILYSVILFGMQFASTECVPFGYHSSISELNETALESILQNDDVASFLQLEESLGFNVIDMKFTGGWSTIHLAAKFGSLKIAESLIGKGVNVRVATDTSLEQPVHIAALFCNYQILERLIASDSTIVNATQANGQTPVFYATRCQNVDKVTKVVELMLVEHGADSMHNDEWQRLPIHEAVANNNVKVASILAKFGDKQMLLRRDIFGHTALLLAVTNMSQAYASEVAKLYDNETGIHLQEPMHNETALHIAARRNHFNLASILLHQNADSTIRNAEHKTPLHIAVIEQNLETVSVLSRNGASVWTTDGMGQNSLHLAITKCPNAISATIVDMLISSLNESSWNELIHSIDNLGESPFEIAVARNNIDFVRVLLAKFRASCDKINKYGQTPVQFAKSLGYDDLAVYMLESGKCFWNDSDDASETVPNSSRWNQPNCNNIKVVERRHLDAVSLNGDPVTQCGGLPLVGNGFIESGSSAIGAVRNVRCNYGYVLKFANISLCQENGDWSIPGICQEGNKSFLLLEGPFTWDEARAACRARGYNLALILSDVERASAAALFKMNSEGRFSAWIGLKRDGVSQPFKWLNGRELTYTDWMDGEPNNLFNAPELCVHYWNWETYGPVQWNDSICGLQGVPGTPAYHGALCELLS